MAYGTDKLPAPADPDETLQEAERPDLDFQDLVDGIRNHFLSSYETIFESIQDLLITYPDFFDRKDYHHE